MRTLTMSYIDGNSKILLHDDHNKIVRIGIASFHFILEETFEETIKRYLNRFNISKKVLKNIAFNYD